MRSLAPSVLFGIYTVCASVSADAPTPGTWTGPVYEYASVRWMGDRTSIIWPDGTTQKVVAFGGRRRPEGTDERAWYLTGAMNIMAKRGFEFVHMTSDDVVMRRLEPKQKE